MTLMKSSPPYDIGLTVTNVLVIWRLWLKTMSWVTSYLLFPFLP
jgi:hypothetical protein